MASINQLISEIAHAVGQPNNVPLKRNIKLAIIHTRNELIRQSYVNNRYTDKGLMQRFRLSLINIPDGDLNGVNLKNKNVIVKRTATKVPRPVRLTNNLPFHSVRTVGYNSKLIPFIKEGIGQFYAYVPGMCSIGNYDYINEHIYVFANKNSSWQWLTNLGNIIIESVFEHPTFIPVETKENKNNIDYDLDTDDELDDNEFLLPEDMIGQIKDIIFKRNLLQIAREQNTIPLDNLTD